MLCPTCGSDTRIVDSRPVGNGRATRRRRECAAGHRFTTAEIPLAGDARYRESCDEVVLRAYRTAFPSGAWPGTAGDKEGIG